MTSFGNDSVKCPSCGTLGNFTRYHSINVTLHPELKEQMNNLELFTWQCPHCKNKYLLSYSFLYHDMQEGILDWYSLNYNENMKNLGFVDIIKPDLVKEEPIRHKHSLQKWSKKPSLWSKIKSVFSK